MRSFLLKLVGVFVIFFGIFVGSYLVLLNIVSPEFDMVSVVSNVIDGDTFEIDDGNRIRLADINTPEFGEGGYEQATGYIDQLIYGETVYLDVDDLYRWDNTGERLVCVVYVNHNVTHYLNVNMALLEIDYAVVWDHDNEFNPSTWSLYRTKVSSESRRYLLYVSVAIGLVSSLVIVFLVWRGYKFGKGFINKVGDWGARRSSIFPLSNA